MHSTALTVSALQAPAPCTEAFILPEFQVFTSIPDCHYYGIVALRGAVMVYEDTLCREGVLEGGYYVVENQHAPAGMGYDRWLEGEREGADRRAQPRSPLKISRRVVQLIRHPRMPDHWLRRETSGFSDGPYPDWSIGFDLIGKVVGIYIPDFQAPAGGAS